MYCKYCGNEVDDNAVVCIHCGAPTDKFSAAKQPAGNDAPSAGFAVLCFFFPVVGLVLYLVWKDTFPLRAKSCGKGALIGVIVEVAVTLIYVLIIFALLGGTHGLLL